MASMMFAFVLLCVLVQFGCGQVKPSANLTCDQLPRVPFPHNKKWSANGPLVSAYSLTSQFDCSTFMAIPPERGSVTAIGYVIIIGESVTVHQYTMSDDHKTGTSIDSKLGRNITWFCTDADPEGGFHCSRVCDGPALMEFHCTTNNDKEFEARIAKAVALGRQVPNGEKIHPAQDNCTQRQHFIF